MSAIKPATVGLSYIPSPRKDLNEDYLTMGFSIPRRWLQTISIAVIACVFSLVAVACAGGGNSPSVTAQDDAAVVSSLDRIIEAGTIKIAVPQDFAPFGSVDASGNLEGYDIDVANLIAEDLGVELELVPVTSDNRIPFLQTNKVDLVISSMGANPERAKSIFFSIPMLHFSQASMVHRIFLMWVALAI